MANQRPQPGHRDRQISQARHPRGAVMSEVVIDIGGGNKIVSLISSSSAKRLKLKKGAQAVAIIQPALSPSRSLALSPSRPPGRHPGVPPCQRPSRR